MGTKTVPLHGPAVLAIGNAAPEGSEALAVRIDTPDPAIFTLNSGLITPQEP